MYARKFGVRDGVVTSLVFWEIVRQSRHVLVGFGLCRGDFVRLAGERGGLTRDLLLPGNVGEVFSCNI